MKRTGVRPLASVIFGTLASCGGAPRPHVGAPADLHVAVRTGAITAPDSARPGWTRVHVEEAEDSHIVVVFRLPATSSSSDVREFVAALDTAPNTPRPGVAMGGPEVGLRGDVIVHLTPGTYVLACVRRGKDGHRHAITGESSALHVQPVTSADSIRAAAPQSTHTVRMIDFAFTGPERWASGAQLLQIVNTGEQDHQLRLARLRDGASLQTWMSAEDPKTVAKSIAGMARIGPGEVAYLPVDLEPGTYIAYCLITDLSTKRSHTEMGMLREIHVR